MTEKADRDIGIEDLRSVPLDVQARMRRVWSDEEWAGLSVEERARLSAWIVQLISADIAEAMATGTFNSREETHVSRTISLVDEQGWRELTRIQAEALEASFAVRSESAERLAESGEEAIAAMSAMVCCELPRRSSRSK